jgi:transposase
MRGKKQAQRQFVAMIDVNARIPEHHPIREIKRLSDEVFGRLSPRFEAMYSEMGRPSIPPERLLGARLLMALFSVPSERAFCERLRYDLLFQWFLDLELEEEPFDASTFSKNQQRLLEHQVADEFFAEVVDLLRQRHLLSEEHFSVDGTLIDAWASLKSFRPKDEGDQGPKDSNGWGDFSGQKRSNDTHESTTDPQAKLLKKGEGKEAKLCFTGHAVMENRHGFCVSFELTPSVGVTESQMALEQLKHLEAEGFCPTSVGADKNYHNGPFVAGCRDEGIKPHVATIKDRKVPGLDGRTTGSKGYQISQTIRKRTEQIFGWMKTVGSDAPEPLRRGRAHRRGLQMGGVGAEPVALGQAEPGAAGGRGAGVSPRQAWCAQIQEIPEFGRRKSCKFLPKARLLT